MTPLDGVDEGPRDGWVPAQTAAGERWWCQVHRCAIVSCMEHGEQQPMRDRVSEAAGRQVEMADIDTIFYNPHHPYTLGLLASLPRLDEREARALVAGLPEDRGAWRAAPGSWSVAECLDHLATANRVYLAAMQPCAAQAQNDGRRRRGPAQPSRRATCRSRSRRCASCSEGPMTAANGS